MDFELLRVRSSQLDEIEIDHDGDALLVLIRNPSLIAAVMAFVAEFNRQKGASYPTEVAEEEQAAGDVEDEPLEDFEALFAEFERLAKAESATRKPSSQAPRIYGGEVKRKRGRPKLPKKPEPTEEDDEDLSEDYSISDGLGATSFMD